MGLEYRVNEKISHELYIDLLVRSTLGQRRPIDQPDIIQAMLEHADLLISAWADELLVGVARSLTDYNYVCYLADLCVDQAYQSRGIGLHLQRLTQQQLGPQCMIVLLAAPQAVEYYHDSCWIRRGLLSERDDS
jgi:GNAT superfamily N-acetyltransferase